MEFGALLFILILIMIFLIFFLLYRVLRAPEHERIRMLSPHSALSRILPHPPSANKYTTFSNATDQFVRMGYGIEEEKDHKQYLAPQEETHAQLIVETLPDVHVSPKHEPIPEATADPSNLRRVMSTDSLDSTTSSLMENEPDLPTLHIILKYDEPTQMLSAQVQHLSDVYTDYGQIWMLFFLLPHPKPLWRTEPKTTPSSYIEYNCIFQQCVRKADLSKIALLVQLYSSRQQSASIVGQSRLRLRDACLTPERSSPIALPLQPNKVKTIEEEDGRLGEMLFLTAFSQDRLTVVVSKIRNLDLRHKSAFVRLYVVQPMGKISKKKTSERGLLHGATDIGESMFFTIPRSRLLKGHLRLSVVCTDENGISKSIGHVTLGPKSSGKEFGHWNRAIQGDGPPLATWHAIRPRNNSL